MKTAIVDNSSGLVKGSPGKVFWASVYLGNPTIWVGLKLADSVDGASALRLAEFITSGAKVKHHKFDPPIEFDTAIYASKDGIGTTKVTIGYE